MFPFVETIVYLAVFNFGNISFTQSEAGLNLRAVGVSIWGDGGLFCFEKCSWYFLCTVISRI